ncbi:MAG: hypothetical protein HYS81_03600 [Candidatus Aenigmatarchaeota archaeon]|nr:MAG: hypothetical protein HYS81_03600 [Candidatus Aenigmarchaeota archaeon]
MTRNKEFWKEMGEDGFVGFLKERGMDEQDIATVRRRNPLVYDAAHESWMDLKAKNPDRRDLGVTGKERFVEYLRENGLADVGPPELAKRDGDAYRAAKKYGWLDVLKRGKRKARNWGKMDREGFVSYMEEEGLGELGPKELARRDPGAYDAAREHGWLDALKRTRRAPRDWEEMGRRGFIDYLQKNGWENLSPTGLSEKDPGAYKAARKHGWLDILKRKTFPRERQAKQFLESNQSANAIASLAFDGYISDVADILALEWPSVFPDAEELARQLPRIVPSVGKHVKPLDFPINNENLELIFSEHVPQRVHMLASDIILNVGVEYFQLQFNRDPAATLEKMHAKTQSYENPRVRNIFCRIHEYYSAVAEFEIPGFGKMKGVRHG